MTLQKLRSWLSPFRSAVSDTAEVDYQMTMAARMRDQVDRSLRDMCNAMNSQFESISSGITTINAKRKELSAVVLRGQEHRSDQVAPDQTAAVQNQISNKNLNGALRASHHAIFRKFGPGVTKAPAGYHREYGGNIVSQDLWTPTFLLTDEGYPIPSEELFEWIDLLESIDDAANSYVMAEIGAGFGRWLGAAACLVRQYKPMPLRLIAVEAEPVHFEWIKRYFSDNGVDWREHHLVQAAVGGSDGFVDFVIGNPREWYGQAVQQAFTNYGWNYADRPEAQIVKVPLISLETLLKDEGVVDFVDMDIQASEGEVVVCSHRTLSEKVKRLHIGTHNAEVERLIYDTLRREGWFCTATYPAHATSETPYGEITFADGIQSWVNPRLF